MDELREKIARLALIWRSDPASTSGDFADAILVIPELAEALQYRNAVLASRLPDLPPDRVGYLIQNLANRVAD